jgi:hypothetical protein
MRSAADSKGEPVSAWDPDVGVVRAECEGRDRREWHSGTM